MSDRDVRGRQWAAVIWLVLAVIGLLAGPAAGQGSAEDYRRAAEMPGLVRGKVLNERLDAAWLDGRTLVCRIEERDGSRFERIDAETGGRGPAFDHDEVARGLTRLLGRRVLPGAIPIERLALVDGGLVGLIAGEPRAVSIDGESGAVAWAEDGVAGAFSLPATVDTRSRGGGPETAIVFHNHTDGPVEILWLDHGGAGRAYATVEPGGVHRQHTFTGHLWQVRSADGEDLGRFRAERRPGTVIVGLAEVGEDADGEQSDEDDEARPGHVSPDGQYQIRIEAHNAAVIDRATGAEIFRTSDGHAEDRYTGRVHWSPDGRRAVIVREVPAERHTVSMIDTAPDDQLQPKLVQHQYLKPGDRIAVPTPVLIDAERRTARPVADGLIGNAWSIGRFTWSPDGSAFWFVYNRRGHQVLRVIRVDAETGKSRVIVEETSETFIDYAGKLYMRVLHGTEGGTGTLLWMSERDGRNRLYICDAATGDGMRPVFLGDEIVRRVESMDEDAGTVTMRVVGRAGQDPYHEHLVRVSLRGESAVVLTEGDGTHEIAFSPGGAFYIDTYSRVDMPPVHELRRSLDGKLVTKIARADWSALLETGWHPPERFVAKGRDGETDIWGVIYRPSTFDAETRYPVIEQIYAGPHGHFVPKTFAAWHGPRAVAELGFIVVQIDGLGTNWRSKSFHDVAWKNLADSGFPDRIAWLKSAAKTRPWMDLSRVGIYGGSAGGQSALRAVLAHGDFYHAAAADCGCHDNRMDKIWWNELWMGWPVGEHYAEQSNVTNAHRLEGDLLLVVGELDRNVDPASTMQVVDALIRADKDFELLVMPGVGHGAMGSPYGSRRMKDFFVRKLLGVEPRWE